MLLILIDFILIPFNFVLQQAFHLFVVAELIIDVGFILFVVEVRIQLLDVFSRISINVYFIVSI